MYCLRPSRHLSYCSSCFRKALRRSGAVWAILICGHHHSVDGSSCCVGDPSASRSPERYPSSSKCCIENHASDCRRFQNPIANQHKYLSNTCALELLELIEHGQGSVIAVNVRVAASSCGVAHAPRGDAHQLIERVIVPG